MTDRPGRALVWTLLAVTVASGAGAQDLSITGYAETDQIGYFQTTDADGHNGRNGLLTQLNGSAAFGRPLRFFGSVELRADFADHDRDRVYLEELYGDFTYKAFDIRVGRQILAWGKADLVNPTDNFSPRDFRDPLESDDERLPVFGARPRLQLGGVVWEAAIVPVFTGSKLPLGHVRWTPPIPSQIQNPFNPGQFVPLGHVFEEPREPETTFGNIQYATRVSATVRGYDISGSYFDGWEDVPRLIRQVVPPTGAGTFTLRITPENFPKRAVGGDVAKVVGPFTLRSEAAYTDSDPRQGPDYFQYVLGMERTFGDLLGSDGTFLLIQWIHSVLPSDFVASPLDFTYLFKKTTTLRVRRNLSTAAQVVVEGLYEWARKGYYVQPGASYKFGDNVRLEGFVDLLGGRETEFFGLFGDNKRLQVRLRYSF